jgi:hypothetical protein
MPLTGRACPCVSIADGELRFYSRSGTAQCAASLALATRTCSPTMAPEMSLFNPIAAFSQAEKIIAGYVA